MNPLQIFIGYDSKEPIAYHVLSNSILRRASCPVSITPLVQDQLRHSGLYTRERGATESTEFSLTRFLVPHLCNYQGIALFLDCDMLCLTDIAELIPVLERSDKAVHVCQHDYVPKSEIKFLGQQQTTYPRKNWSSFMAFNLQHYGARKLTPEYVNTATGLQLHRFQWLEDHQIGSLPLEWNWLVGEYDTGIVPKMLHYTLGGPWFPETEKCDYSYQWNKELSAILTP